jgi:hypothetical protein
MFADNLLDNESQIEGFRALLGLHEHRPFECVGEQAESMVAMNWIAHQEDWKSRAVVAALRKEIPGLGEAHPELEAQVFGERESHTLMPTPYDTLGRVLA